jgi:SAM-dependent methyltransferase
LYNISDEDTMFRANEMLHYITVGQSARRCIAECLAPSAGTDIQRLLDFGCGYGRVLRVLRRQFPHATITASDTDHGAADFCARVFGATPVYSSVDATKVEFNGQFDLIWSGSVFSHLERDSWQQFLALLTRALDPDGSLIFTTHGPDVEKAITGGALDYGLTRESVTAVLEGYEDSGFGFGDYPLVKRHDYPEDGRYGVTVIDPDVVRSVAASTGLRVVKYLPTGWDNHQDVFACRHAEAVGPTAR